MQEALVFDIKTLYILVGLSFLVDDFFDGAPRQ